MAAWRPAPEAWSLGGLDALEAMEAWRLCRPIGLVDLEVLEAWRSWRFGGLGLLEALESWGPGDLEAWSP